MEGEFKFDFENLIVYQKSLELIDKIFEIYKKLPQDYKYSLGANLLRAGLSIANNLAEGNGKKFIKEKTRYFSTSLDSTRECISVFNVLERQKFINKDTYHQLRCEGKEITNMIWKLIDSQK